jgi:FAD/FMN-containing dehydrogenase
MHPVLRDIQELLGPQGVLLGEAVRARAANIKGDPCQAAAIVRPGSTAELARVMALCHAAGQPVVPLGGGTGLVEGGVASEQEVIVSLERMNRIEELDTLGRSMLVQAGVPLQSVQEQAEAAGLMFPVDLGARGSATIGGMIATNAGGNRVLRYGMMREQVLGLEVVLADGTVVSSLARFIKNNAGYDLKHQFIGSEGTLGIVTRVMLRLRPLPQSRHSALLAVQEYGQVMEMLTLLDRGLGGALSSFEVMWNDFYRTIVTDNPRHTPPLAEIHPYYVLVEALGADAAAAQERFEAVLEQAMEAGLVVDAALAQSRAQQDALWAIRDDIPRLRDVLTPAFGFDISLSLRDMEQYVAEIRSRIGERWPQARMVVFGHLGDGNIHVVAAVGSDDEHTREEVEQIVYGALRERGGSISAEHGIGLEKRAYLSYSRSEPEIALMRTLKTALDPKGILNPGKILD